jgi:mono/diheme cytochrome c family protein
MVFVSGAIEPSDLVVSMCRVESVMNWSRANVSGALLLVLLGSTPAFAQPTSVLARRGEDLLSRECSMCHAIGRRGGGPQQSAPSFADIARRGDLSRIRRALESGTTSGHPMMPRLALGPADIDAILAYLATLGEP